MEVALTNAIAESYLQGISTRRIRDVISHLVVKRLSASTVSRISKELDEKVEEFLKRPIERPIPCIFFDAIYFKVRDGGKYFTKVSSLSREIVTMNIARSWEPRLRTTRAKAFGPDSLIAD